MTVAISFVVPAFNEEKLIEATIQSIRAECGREGIDYEIIVVDNGSTDWTARLARNAGARVVREDRKGVVWARQHGFEASRHPFIANIDADSELPPGWIRAALRHMRPGVCAVTGPLVYHDLSRSVRVLALGFYGVALVCMKTLGASLQGGNCIIRREALDAIGGYDTGIAFYGEDTMTAKRLKGHGRIVFAPRMRVWSSGRRLEAQGVVKTAWLYTINYLSVTLRSRSKTDEYKDWR